MARIIRKLPDPAIAIDGRRASVWVAEAGGPARRTLKTKYLAPEAREVMFDCPEFNEDELGVTLLDIPAGQTIAEGVVVELDDPFAVTEEQVEAAEAVAAEEPAEEVVEEPTE
jgi:hypothetical protein